MKRISYLPLIGLLCAATLASAQDAAPAPRSAFSSQEAEENYKSLKGHVQDMLDAQAAQDKRLQAMAREISDLREQVSKPTGNYATQDDLKRLADAIQEIDKKREADKDLILKEIGKLGKVVSAPPTRSHTPTPVSADPPPPKGGDEPMFSYQIKSGDRLSLIAQAYKDQGYKVTTQQILDANPGLNPDKLVIGKKINIPAVKTTAAK